MNPPVTAPVRRHAARLILLTLLLAPSAQAARVPVPATTLSIELPADFTAMTTGAIATKYGRGGQRPTTVYSTPGPNYSVNIAFRLAEQAVTPQQLPELKSALEKAVQATPGFRWVSRGFTKVAGREWIVLRFWVDGLDAPIYNDMRVTSESGKMLLVTANSSTSAYSKYSAKLTAALLSLK
ncbi:hypothetical protein [Deinococcus sp.]|uniref:hypothetical protein n=1 Tax=Deinococcus sp. TaxID=47478 RepID=UPI0025CC2E33|nr:hypothetical protein [Deinococcus sp.]